MSFQFKVENSGPSKEHYAFSAMNIQDSIKADNRTTKIDNRKVITTAEKGGYKTSLLDPAGNVEWEHVSESATEAEVRHLEGIGRAVDSNLEEGTSQ